MVDTVYKSSEATLNIDGVVINVALDFKKRTATFTDKDSNPCRFVFADRTRDYLGGWVKIFRALEEATKWADERLAEAEKIEAEKKEKKFINIMMAISDLEDTKPPVVKRGKLK